MKPILFFYSLYTIYTFFVMSVSNYNVVHALVGLAFLWAILGCYWLGKVSVKSKKATVVQEEYGFLFHNIAEWKRASYILFAVVNVLCAVFAAQYYTGRNFFEVISGIFSDDSAYYSYQQYMKQNNIATFSVLKLPFIFMLAFNSIMLLWSMTGLLLKGGKLDVTKILYLVTVIISYLYFGWARGTNFEMYFVVILSIYCLVQKIDFKNWKTNKKRTLILLGSVVLLCCVAILLFRLVLTGRGVTFKNTICTEIQFNPDSLIAKLFPTITNMGLSVFAYFGYGIFTIGVTITEIVCSSGSSILYALLPCGFTIFTGTSLQGYIRETIDIGVKWVPDTLVFADYLGILTILFIIFLVGRYAEIICCRRKSPLLKELINAVIYIEMLSLPIGNFILSSSALSIMTLAVFVVSFQPFFKKGFLTLKKWTTKKK